jgi:putative aldouronate transport system substrate-binding protein
MKKRRFSVLLVACIMCISWILTGCASKNSDVNEDTNDNQSSQSGVTEEAAATDAPATLEYYGNDISQHLDMTMYVIGDEPAMADDVEAKINEVLEKKANVTLSINYISLSDYTTKYSLLLASGENIDIIYSASWANYFEEAKKDAYLEITEDMITKFMPQTAQGQDKDSYGSIKVNGKIFMIPKNSVYANNAVPVLIRGDLREKYGMDPIDSYDKLEAYLKAVADNEQANGIYPYAAGTDGVELSIQMFQCKNNLFPSTSLGKYIGYFYNGNNQPTADDMVWEYTTDQYKQFVELAKKWADEGFWSKNAVSNTISPADAFINGTSASVFWNYDTCMTIYNTVIADHPDWKPEIVDANPSGARYKAPFSEGMSVPAVASNPERSMMVIDLLKWDKEIYDTARYGIEGRSWVATSDTTYQLGDEQGNYTVGNAPITWGLKNDALERIIGEAGDTRSDIYLQLFSNPIGESTAGFTFDNTAVKDKIAAIDELCSQYIPILELGLVDDPDATLAEFNQKCEQAGMNDILTEFKNQYIEYMKTQQ